MSIFSSNFQKNSVHLKDLFFNLNESKTLFVKDKMHETCSYTAMYPAKLAHLLISNFSNIHDKVYDPFSGRGTTLLEARRLNRITYASDLSPLAYVLSRGKCKKISKNTVILRINELSNLYKKAKISFDFDEFKYMRTYFTDEVLKQLYFIRNMIGSQWKNIDDCDNYILAALLGILHGPTKKDGSSSYCSISMRNTTAMSRNYVEKYVREHEIKFPTNDNIFEKLLNKVERISRNGKVSPNAKLKLFDALKCNECFKNNKMDLILTSPPYLNVFSYTRENWIRLWLLGYKRENVSSEIKLDDSHKIEEYKLFLTKFLNVAEKSMTQNGKLIIVVGDIRDKFTFRNIWEQIGLKTNLILSAHYQDFEILKKMTTCRNGIRSSKNATRIDNICVFERRIK